MPHDHSDEEQEEARRHALDHLKKYGPIDNVLMCKNCGMLCFVREKEEIPIRCGYCLTTGIPPKFWQVIQVKELVQDDVPELKVRSYEKVG